MGTDTAKLIHDAEKSGFTVTKRRRTGHIKFQAPDGQVLFSAGTPSDVRGTANTRSRLRKAGMGTENDNGKEARLARARQSTDSVSYRILEVLQAHPGEPLNTGKIRLFVRDQDMRNGRGASATPETSAISATLHYLKQHHPELVSVARGIWRYGHLIEPEAEEPEPEPATISPISANNLHELNGHVPEAVPELPFNVSVEPDVRQPITVIATPFPEGSSSLFEAVTIHKNGAIVQRDTNGELWIAFPLRFTLPVVELKTN